MNTRVRFLRQVEITWKNTLLRNRKIFLKKFPEPYRKVYLKDKVCGIEHFVDAKVLKKAKYKVVKYKGRQ